MFLFIPLVYVILSVVNLDPHHVQSGWLVLPLEELGVDPERPYEVHELITDTTYLWQGVRNYVELDPARLNAHVLHISPRMRTEEEFEYYL